MARVLPILVVLGFLIAGSTFAAQNQPLPDQESFLIETRKHLQTDSTLQSGYVYVETRRELKLDKGGRTREESVKVFESYPGLPGEGRWERLIAEDGRPVPPENWPARIGSASRRPTRWSSASPGTHRKSSRARSGSFRRLVVSAKRR